MKKRIMKCLLMGLLTAGMLLPCMSVKASSGTGNSETVSAASSGTFNEGVETEKNDIDRQIRELEGIQYSLGEQKEMAEKEYLRYKEEGKLKEAEEAYKRKESLGRQIQGLDPQIGSLYSRKDQINGRSPIGTFVKLEGITSGEPYSLVVYGSLSGGRKVISTAQFTNPGTIRFTEDCDIENLHILAADTVTAAPGADVNIGNLIVIGNDTKISNIKVNTLIVPQSASQAAKLSYYQTAQSMLAASKFMSYREMNAEEQAGWGNDLFGASFQALPTQSEPVPELKAVLVPPSTQTGGGDVEPSDEVIP